MHSCYVVCAVLMLAPILPKGPFNLASCIDRLHNSLDAERNNNALAYMPSAVMLCPNPSHHPTSLFLWSLAFTAAPYHLSLCMRILWPLCNVNLCLTLETLSEAMNKAM